MFIISKIYRLCHNLMVNGSRFTVEGTSYSTNHFPLFTNRLSPLTPCPFGAAWIGSPCGTGSPLGIS